MWVCTHFETACTTSRCSNTTCLTMDTRRYEEEEEVFRVRAYGFGELAQLYLPHVMPKSATNRLRVWIVRNEPLLQSLEASGWRRYSKTLTPLQVRLIVGALGEP